MRAVTYAKQTRQGPVRTVCNDNAALLAAGNRRFKRRNLDCKPRGTRSKAKIRAGLWQGKHGFQYRGLLCRAAEQRRVQERPVMAEGYPTRGTRRGSPKLVGYEEPRDGSRVARFRLRSIRVL